MKNWASDFLYQLMRKNIIVTQYYYRSAYPTNILFRLERDDELENFLSKKSGERKDNHTLYEIKFEDGSSVCIGCSDLLMNIGVGVTEKNW